jgi:hypothetical protein
MKLESELQKTKREEKKEIKSIVKKAQQSYRELRQLDISREESRRYIENAYSCIGKAHFQDKIMKYAIRLREKGTWHQPDFEIYLEALFFNQRQYKD